MNEILQFDSDSEVAFRGVHDYRETAGADGEIPSEVHIGLDFIPVESGGIHDDLNKRLYMVLMLRRLGEGSGGLSARRIAARCRGLPECREGNKPRFSANLQMPLNEELSKGGLVSDALFRGYAGLDAC